MAAMGTLVINVSVNVVFSPLFRCRVVDNLHWILVTVQRYTALRD